MRPGPRALEAFMTAAPSSTHRRRRTQVLAAVCAAAAARATAGLGGAGHAAPTTVPGSREEVARLLLDNGHLRFASAGAQRAARFAAGLDGTAGRQITGDSAPHQTRATGGVAA